MTHREWSASDLNNALNFRAQHELIDPESGEVLDWDDRRHGIIRLKKAFHDQLPGPRIQLSCERRGHGTITTFVRQPGTIVSGVDGRPVEGHDGYTWKSWDTAPHLQRGPAMEHRDPSVDYWERKHEHFTIDIVCPACHPKHPRTRSRGRNLGLHAPKFSELLDLVWFSEPRDDGEDLTVTVQALEIISSRHFSSDDWRSHVVD
jgi:hypothetical protein